MDKACGWLLSAIARNSGVPASLNDIVTFRVRWGVFCTDATNTKIICVTYSLMCDILILIVFTNKLFITNAMFG